MTFGETIMQQYGDYTFHGTQPRVTDDTADHIPLDAATLPAEPVPVRTPDPTDDGLGCSDGGEWRDADPDLWAFGACVVMALLVLIAVCMFAAG